MAHKRSQFKSTLSSIKVRVFCFKKSKNFNSNIKNVNTYGDKVHNLESEIVS